jgi:hypothetical protein
MAVSVVIAQVVPILQLLSKIIEYLTELQKNSKKHSATLAELKVQMVQLKKTIEQEIDARNKEQELAAADRIFIRKLLCGVGILACSPWIYIGLHLGGWIR